LSVTKYVSMLADDLCSVEVARRWKSVVIAKGAAPCLVGFTGK